MSQDDRNFINSEFTVLYGWLENLAEEADIFAALESLKNYVNKPAKTKATTVTVYPVLK